MTGWLLPPAVLDARGVLAVLGEELRLLGALLGAVRDLDVLLEHLEQEVETLGDDRPGGEALLAVLATERAIQRDVLVDAMETERYSALLDEFRNAIDGLGPIEGDDTAAHLAKRAVRSLRRAAEALPADPADDQLHAVRIDAKRARYAAELAALDGSKSAVRAVGALKVLQDVIGVHQDAVVAEERLRRIASPESAVAAGRLIERGRSRKAGMRARYPGALRDALREGRKAFS